MNATGEGETVQARRKRLSMVPRACEGCKVRKIRCDRSTPCSNCLTAGIVCQRTNPGIRHTDRPRHQEETYLKEKIECLEQRLNAVERRLGRVAFEYPEIESVANEIRPGTEYTTVDSQSTDAPRLYEGGPSFTNQSIQASDVAQRRAKGTRDLGPDFNASLAHLESLLQSSATVSSSEAYRFSGKSAGVESLRPLPFDLVLAILEEMKRKHPIFLCSYAVNDPALVERLCQKIYFPTASTSSGDLSAMFGVLYFLLREFSILQNSLCRKYDIKSYTIQCGRSFNAAIEAYDVLAVPSFENIFALIMGFTKAQDEAKPLLSYTLISAAANQCQMLGYQKESVYRTSRTETDCENMRRLFWSTYVFEKQLCFLFGRSSSIQDLDIDAQYPVLSADPAIRPWDESFVMAIKLANLQGRIYDKLYTSAAMKADYSERARHMDDLSTDMQKWRVELEQIDSRWVNNQKIFELSRDSWDIMYYSTFTSLLRAPTSSQTGGGEISSQCFHVARLSLQSHLRCFGNYQASGFLTDSDYANWVLLFSSFTPFIVIFLHAIASSSASDVQLLEEVVKSLQRLRRVSSSLQRLYHICSLFVQIARALAETPRSCIGTYDRETDSLQFPTDGYASFFETPTLQNLLEPDTHMANHTGGNLDACDLSAILDCWTTGVPFGIEMFKGS